MSGNRAGKGVLWVGNGGGDPLEDSLDLPHVVALVALFAPGVELEPGPWWPLGWATVPPPPRLEQQFAHCLAHDAPNASTSPSSLFPQRAKYY